MRRLLIIRHGESTSDPERRVGGDYDDDLTDRGRDQARLLAARLARDYRIDALYVSNLKRAAQTADAVAAATGVVPVFDVRLRERSNGELAGLTYEEVGRRFTPPVGGWRPFHRPPKGETAIEHFARISDFYFRLRDGSVDKELSGVPTQVASGLSAYSEAGNPDNAGGRSAGPAAEMSTPETVAIVAHGGTNQHLIRLLLGLTLDSPIRFGMGDTSINEFEFPVTGITVVRMNDTSHLL